MLPKSSIGKGKILEKWIIERLKLSGLDNRATRNPGSGSGLMKGDINNDLNIHFECKNQKNFNGKQWFKQMKEENVSNLKECLIWHMPNTPLDDSKVIIDWWWFEELLKHSKEPIMKEIDKTLKWKLETLKNAINQVIKELN